MLPAVSIKCSNCGAELTQPPTPAAIGGQEIVCEYCGSHNALQPPAPAIVSPRRVVVPPRAPARPVMGSVGVGVILALIVVGSFVLRAGIRGIPGIGGLFGDKSNWDEGGGPPAIAKIAGTEAVVGRLRGPDDQLFVGAYDGATLELRWKAGPYGTYSQAYKAIHFAVSGAHVVVSDAHSVLHLIDLETGKDARTVTLTDKVEVLCPRSADRMWVRQVDERTVDVDLTTGAVSAAPTAPPGCDASSTHGAEVKKRDLPKIPGFESKRELDAESAVVLLGEKSPGTATPMLVGLDPKTLAIRWQEPLPSVDLATVRADSKNGANAAVHHDRVIATYGVGEKSWHVAAIDAKTGARQWDVVLRPIFAVDWLQGVTCTDTRVYIVRMQTIDVLDAVTGKAIGTIGSDTYR